MKSLLSLLLLSVLSLPSVVLGVDFDELVKRDGLYYKKFMTVPFIGKTSGLIQTTFKDGEEHALWIYYSENGQLKRKRIWKDGKQHGPSVEYHENRQLTEKGNYKDDKRHGSWVMYYKDGKKID